jgi:hypothetical protein
MHFRQRIVHNSGGAYFPIQNLKTFENQHLKLAEGQTGDKKYQRIYSLSIY